MEPSKPLECRAKFDIWKYRSARVPDLEKLRKARPPRVYRNDVEPLNEAQRELAEKFLPLARKLAKPLKQHFRQWHDEFESAACLALVEAARSFDPSRQVQFATFARYRIRGALVDVGRMMSIDYYWDDSDDDDAPNVVTLTPWNEEHGHVLVAVSPPPVGMETDDVDAVEHLLLKLPSKHRDVCRQYYLYGKTQTEIARGMGCSQSEITRLHRKAIELLSDPYGEKKKEKSNRRSWNNGHGKRKGGEPVDVVIPLAVPDPSDHCRVEEAATEIATPAPDRGEAPV